MMKENYKGDKHIAVMKRGDAYWMITGLGNEDLAQAVEQDKKNTNFESGVIATYHGVSKNALIPIQASITMLTAGVEVSDLDDILDKDHMKGNFSFAIHKKADGYKTIVGYTSKDMFDALSREGIEQTFSVYRDVSQNFIQTAKCLLDQGGVSAPKHLDLLIE